MVNETQPETSHEPELRRALSQEMTMKYSPDLRFVLDESFDRMEETSRLLRRDDVRRDIDDGA